MISYFLIRMHDTPDPSHEIPLDEFEVSYHLLFFPSVFLEI